MSEETTAVNTDQSAATDKTEGISTVGTQEDNEARFAELEAQKAKAIEEAANWKMAALKAKSKTKEVPSNEDDDDDDDRIRRITSETLANSKLVEIAREQDAIIKKALKENKELKLAQLNKQNTPPAAMGTHTENPKVQDTMITPEQMAAFKKMGWDDKTIERYKANYKKYGGR